MHKIIIITIKITYTKHLANNTQILQKRMGSSMFQLSLYAHSIKHIVTAMQSGAVSIISKTLAV